MTTTVPATPTQVGPDDGRQTDAREQVIMRFRTMTDPDLATRNYSYLSSQRDREQADQWPYFRHHDTALARAAAVAGKSLAGSGLR